MKRLLLLLFIATAIAAQGGDRFAVVPLPKQDPLEQSALTLMQDVVPRAPTSDAMVKISGDGTLAIYGKIFNDAQIGALVAVNSDRPKASDADLCLLLWQGHWNFVQRIGKVPWADVAPGSTAVDAQNWNWALKQRAPGEPYYVVSGLNLNMLSYQEHPSWLCDAKTHSLLPTGWPQDAIPSLSGHTITFQRCAKSGYVPTVFEIDEFDGKPGKNLAVITNAFMGAGQSRITVTMPDSATGKRIAWTIAPPDPIKYEIGHDRRLLGFSPVEGSLGPFYEDATVDIQWGTDRYPNDAVNFLVWRLTGIESAAQMGYWDEDLAAENEQWVTARNQKPARAAVVGPPEAVKAFSWPLN